MSILPALTGDACALRYPAPCHPAQFVQLDGFRRFGLVHSSHVSNFVSFSVSAAWPEFLFLFLGLEVFSPFSVSAARPVFFFFLGF